MTTNTPADKAATVTRMPAIRRGRPRGSGPLAGPGGAALGKEASREARRLAALVLEVLAGARTPTEAAQGLEVSLPRYYQLESRALRGLLAACEPPPQGRVHSVAAELAGLRRDQERLQREVLRQQALVRAAQRTIGLAPPPLPKKTDKKTRQRRLARALRVAGRLQTGSEEKTPAEAQAQANAPAAAGS